MKHILLFGAGKSATCLIHYLVAAAARYQWRLTVADRDPALALSKTGSHAHVQALAIDAAQPADRDRLVKEADIVISLLPPLLHFLVAEDCLRHKKHLLTASYADDRIRSLAPDIKAKQLLFLCEMGLDPGLDHMSAMQLVHRIQDRQGHIIAFRSHCGGLVAPESDNNPWHYKISWNPRNVVMAGKAGAVYLEDGSPKHISYEQLFDAGRLIEVPGQGQLCWYPNRDSLSYLPVYGLTDVQTFVRTTLRHPAFCSGWKHLIDLKLTDDSIFYDTSNLSLAAFFSRHFHALGRAGEIYEKNIATSLLQQLDCLGLYDNTTFINKGSCSAMDILQYMLEKKLALLPGDKDMIVMLHEIDYLLEGKKYRLKSSLAVKGDDSSRTAMAKTVGLPLGIAAQLILQGKIKETGLHLPVKPSIYTSVLAALQQEGIFFRESTAML